MEDDLVADARVARLVTTGRTSREPRPVAVGYLDEPDGSILVAARSEGAGWARNLLADPACLVVIGERRFDAVAEPLDRDDHIRAIRGLILRYGTPSEDLGRGPSFRLRPVVRD
jgi:deazaflavin-dependent oxidoreductase (nitroreductase family)